MNACNIYDMYVCSITINNGKGQVIKEISCSFQMKSKIQRKEWQTFCKCDSVHNTRSL